MNWFHSPAFSDSGFRVTVTGDWAPVWTYEELMRRDPAVVYGDLLPLFQASDLNIVNVECVIGEKGAPLSKPGPCIKGAESIAIPALKAMPAHVATLANNHAMDFGPESLEYTLEVLCKAGIATVGAGMNGAAAAQPLIIPCEAAGGSLAIVNFGEGEACASLQGGPGVNVYTPETQEAQVRALKAAGHLVIAIFHGGREIAAMPPPYVVEGLRRIADAGADAVLAHHPHVPQAVEIYRGVPIAYSLGNFVFRRPDPPTYRSSGYLAHLTIADGTVKEVSLTPYRATEHGVFAMQGTEREAFLYDLRQLSDDLQSPEKVASLWNAFIDDALWISPTGERAEGAAAYFAQLQGALEVYRQDPAAGISRWHHYFFAPAHWHYFLTAFERMKLGTFGDAPEWARERVRRWKQ